MTTRSLVLAPSQDSRLRANRNRLAIVVTLATLLTACDERRSPVFSGPPAVPTPPTEPAVTYTLSGTISEDGPTGVTPLEGAVIVVHPSGQRATTNREGFYSIPGVSALPITVVVSNAGYIAQSRTMTLSGDTRVDLQISRIVTYTLSGVVFERTVTGQVPIEGVSVYCDSCGSPVGHTFASSDENGYYSFEWTNNGSTPLWVTKAGYRLSGALEDRIVATVSGDTRFDIEMIRR
ncbi:MAG: carboxypeptidase regulatory-like domain-containing protein [Acidobacteria bacterium]|nr:carboxypeptidase regulatory-like domain-containing protein [Acidobacteriota bacterium]